MGLDLELAKFAAARERRKRATPSPLFRIEDTFQFALPKTTKAEDASLEKLLLDSNGPVEPLVVWAEENILIDGYRRLLVCQKHNLPYKFIEKSFPNLEAALAWRMLYPLGTRSLDWLRRDKIATSLLRIVGKEEQNSTATRQVAELLGRSIDSIRQAKKRLTELRTLLPGWRAIIDNQSPPIRKFLVDHLLKETPEVQEELLAIVLREGDCGSLENRYRNSEHNREVKEQNRKQAERANRELPPNIPPAIPVHEPSADDLLPKAKRIPVMIKNAEQAGAEFAKECDRLFSKLGLGAHSASSFWKKRIDKGLREIGTVLQEVRDAVETKK